VIVSYNTITLATTITIQCGDEECGYVYNSPSPATANLHANRPDDRKRSTDYAVNILYVLGFISSGDGGVEAARILGLLGLPNDTTMETRTFPKIEDRISGKIQELSKDILLENLTDEVMLLFDGNNNNDLTQWQQALRDPTIVLDKLKLSKIDCSFDMGWQQRSSGNRYASISGDALLVVGCRSRKPIAMIIKCKRCITPARLGGKDEADPHQSRATAVGSSSP
jgi:hypothetical protein